MDSRRLGQGDAFGAKRVPRAALECVLDVGGGGEACRSDRNDAGHVSIECETNSESYSSAVEERDGRCPLVVGFLADTPRAHRR